MPHRTRIILFYTFVLIFLLSGTAVLLYSYGWRLDLETRTLQKIGAIYIKANVRDTTITINGKAYKDAAGILQSGTLISNLLPKTYRVEITKDGYQTYHKTLIVQPSRVEEILNAQLIPNTFEPTFVTPSKGTRFVDATQSADRMIVQDTATGIFYLHTKANASSTVNLNMAAANALKGQKIKKIAFVPFKPTQFVIEDATGFKIFDSERKTIEPLLKGSIAAWSMKDSTILMAQATKGRPQEVASINLIFKTKTTIDDLNKQLATTTYITALASAGNNGTIAFSDVENVLHLFTQKTKEVTRIATNVESFTFSPDGKKLAIINRQGTVTILFIEDYDGDVRKKAGESITVSLPQTERVQSLQWYADSYHLLIERASGLSITEIDDRKPLNIFSILESFIDYRYVAENNSIYFTDKKGISTIRMEK